jgi:quinol monooxygenase YgiN
MSISLIIAGIGALAAAVGSGVLLARSFRGPRPDLIALAVALIGLLISLGAQTLGYLIGFDSAMFRAMEIGAQVIAPLAIILALSEVAARTLAARFCARVYIPALTIVALVVLTLDQLSGSAFSKAWPDPATYYQAPPTYVLMFAIGPVTALVALIAVGVVLRRSGQPAWNPVLPGQLAGGAAALLLAYPALVQLVKFGEGVGLPVRSLFSVLCAAAAGLTWYAGSRNGRLRLSALRRRAADDGRDFDRDDDFDREDDYDDPGYGRREDAAGRGRDRSGDADRWADVDRRDDYDRGHVLDQTGDFDRYYADADAGQGPYRGGGPYGPDSDGDQEDYGWRTAGSRYSDDRGHDAYGGGFETGDFDLEHGAAGPAGLGGPAVLGGPAGPGRGGAGGYPDGHYDGWQDDSGQPGRYGAGRAGREPSRADLFGQIAIYTLLEDRIQEFDELTERVVAQVRAREPDTLVYIVHAVPSAPMQRILYEVYRDRDAYEQHRQQPYVTRFETDRRPYVLATNVIELGLQQAKVSPFPSMSELFGEPGYDTSGFERPDYLRDYGKPAQSSGDQSRSW